MTIYLPNLVAHADWSANPKKRWLALARLTEKGQYIIAAPELVGDPRRLIPRLRQTIRLGGSVLLGFDFPIGLPMRYAQACGITNTLHQINKFGAGEWSEFYQVSESSDQVSLFRPFYPNRPGNAHQSDLIEGLGMRNLDDLRRQCELAHPNRKAAAPLFWTLGGQQVGKAAISGWVDVIAPALSRASDSSGEKIPNNEISIWPFDGLFFDLMKPARTIIAETYPGEFYHHFGIELKKGTGAYSDSSALKDTRSPRKGKRSQGARVASADKLLGWAENTGVLVTNQLREKIQTGFGPSSTGEDPFDATVGLFGILNVLLGLRVPGDPRPGQRYYSEIRNLEGWILGQGHCIMKSGHWSHIRGK